MRDSDNDSSLTQALGFDLPLSEEFIVRHNLSSLENDSQRHFIISRIDNK